jgi:hypothetical protein
MDAAGESSTPVEIDFEPTIAALTGADRKALLEQPAAKREDWLRAKATPPVPTPDADAASATADDQPASTETKIEPASEPAKAAPVKAKGVSARNAELDAEIATLHAKLAERAALRQQVASLETPSVDVEPAASSAVTPRTIAIDLQAPPLDEAAFFTQFPDAPYPEHARYLARYDRMQERAEELDQTVQSFDAKGRAAYPDFREKLQGLNQAGVQFPADVTAALFSDPDLGVRAAYALAGDPALAKRITVLELGRLMERLSAAKPTPDDKPVPKAPPEPPLTLNGTQSRSVDESTAAVAAGDFAAFRAAEARKRQK